jgi:hypothetical protein
VEAGTKLAYNNILKCPAFVGPDKQVIEGEGANYGRKIYEYGVDSSGG